MLEFCGDCVHFQEGKVFEDETRGFCGNYSFITYGGWTPELAHQRNEQVIVGSCFKVNALDVVEDTEFVRLARVPAGPVTPDSFIYVPKGDLGRLVRDINKEV